MSYSQLSRDQNNYITKLKKLLSQEDSDSVKIEDKIETHILEEVKSLNNGEEKHNEIEINHPLKEEREKIQIEEEQKRHHLIDHFDNNIDFKPSSPISRINNINNNNTISMYWNENINNYNNNLTNRQTANNIVFNPAVDNLVFSDEGIRNN